MKVLVLALALTGCATVYDKPWTREGATSEQLYMEKAQCRARVIENGDLMISAHLFVLCMQGKGWHPA